MTLYFRPYSEVIIPPINQKSYLTEHFSFLSLHKICGSYDLELHAVHQSSTKKVAVIGIVYEFGHPDPFLSKVNRFLLFYLLCLIDFKSSSSPHK